MENKYKIGDKLYFGYFTGDDIVVEEHEVITVYEDKIELRKIPAGYLSGIPLSQLKTSKYFDTYEEAYNYARVKVKLS